MLNTSKDEKGEAETSPFFVANALLQNSVLESCSHTKNPLASYKLHVVNIIPMTSMHLLIDCSTAIIAEITQLEERKILSLSLIHI